MECKRLVDFGDAAGNGQQVLARSQRLRQRADFALDHRPAFGHVAQRFLLRQHADQAFQFLDLGAQGRRVGVFHARRDEAQFARQPVEAVGRSDGANPPPWVISAFRSSRMPPNCCAMVEDISRLSSSRKTDDFLMKACRRSGGRTAGERFLAGADGGNVLAGFLGPIRPRRYPFFVRGGTGRHRAFPASCWRNAWKRRLVRISMACRS
jgi:hypothetical protein